MTTGKADLAGLVDRFLAIVESSRNQHNRSKWDHTFPWERDNWRALPLQEFNIVVDPDRPFLAKLLDFDLKSYYQDPEAHLREWLRLNIFEFEQFEDDSYYAPEYRPWWGVVTEVSMFGAPLLFREDREPWIDSPPLLEDKAALDKLTLPDFYSSGLMPLVHLFCDYAAEVLGSRIKVIFPTWARGPLATAMQLRGMQNLLLDMLDDPAFVHRLMRLVTDGRKAWLKQRAEFLNQPIQPGLLFNDEIGAPLLHPGLYREFILPDELELAEFHGGIFYFHSCGDTTLFLDDIITIPGLQLFHVGPQTNLARVVERLNPDIALDICMQDVRDIYETTDEQKRTKLAGIADLCRGRHYYIRADGFDVLTTPEADLHRIQRWKFFIF
jgi:hypothetical protein